MAIAILVIESMIHTLTEKFFFWLQRGLILLPAATLLACSSTPVTVSAEALQEQVRQTEIAFAQTMADRDHQAFQSFLADDAIFIASGQTMRGNQEVAAAWKPLFQTPSAPFSWHPELVEVLGGGDLALSTGPVRDPDGNQVATFTSIWRRTSTGDWEIVFDFGSE